MIKVAQNVEDDGFLKTYAKIKVHTLLYLFQIKTSSQKLEIKELTIVYLDFNAWLQLQWILWEVTWFFIEFLTCEKQYLIYVIIIFLSGLPLSSFALKGRLFYAPRF